jgi:hypothetical protein
MMTDYPVYALDQIKLKAQLHAKSNYPVAVRATRKKLQMQDLAISKNNISEYFVQ